MGKSFFHGKTVWFGLGINDVNFQNLISIFRESLINAGIDNDCIIPYDCLHISLAKFSLDNSNLMDYTTFEIISSVLNLTLEKFKNELNTIKIDKISYGYKSGSVKLYFTEESVDFVEKIRTFIIQKANDHGLCLNNNKLFYPHLTLLDQMYGSLTYTDGHIIKRFVYQLQNKIRFQSVKLTNIKILTPRMSLHTEDKAMRDLAQLLTVDFTPKE